jgi:hypothetical protein
MRCNGLLHRNMLFLTILFIFHTVQSGVIPLVAILQVSQKAGSQFAVVMVSPGSSPMGHLLVWRHMS